MKLQYNNSSKIKLGGSSAGFAFGGGEDSISEARISGSPVAVQGTTHTYAGASDGSLSDVAWTYSVTGGTISRSDNGEFMTLEFSDVGTYTITGTATSVSSSLSATVTKEVVVSAAVASTQYSNFATLQTTVDGTADGGTIDLAGASYITGYDGTQQPPQVVLPQSKAMTITNGTIYNGTHVAASLDESVGTNQGKYGSHTYVMDWDFSRTTYSTTNGFKRSQATGAMPFIFSSEEKPLKTAAVYPVFEKDVEFMLDTSTHDFDNARDDYGWGDANRVSIYTGSSNVSGNGGVEFDSSGGLLAYFLEGTPALECIDAFEWDETGGLVDHQAGCVINSQTLDNRSVAVFIDRVKETADGKLYFYINSNCTAGNVFGDDDNYHRIAVMGPVLELAPGQAVYEPSNGKVYFRPRVAASTSKMIIGDSARSSLFCSGNLGYTYPDSVDSQTNGSKVLTLTNVDFYGGGGAVSSGDVNSSTSRHGAIIHATGCSFKYGNQGAGRGMYKMDQCVVDHNFHSGIYGSQGSKFTRTFFGNTYQSSCINLSVANIDQVVSAAGTDTMDPSEAAFKSIVDQCFFVNPSTQHGQAVSAYQGTNLGFEATNNIIFNTDRGFIGNFGGNTVYVNDVNNGSAVINNNMYITTSMNNIPSGLFTSNTDNFSGIREGTLASNTALTSSDDRNGYEVSLFNNTIYSTRDSAPEESTYSSSPFRANTRYANCLLNGRSGTQEQYFDAGTFTDGKTSVVQSQKCFALRPYRTYSNWATSGDLTTGFVDTTGEYIDDCWYWIDPNTLEVQQSLTTAATDGGKLGVRYTGSVPSMLDIQRYAKREKTQWWVDYTPAAVASPTFNDVAAYGMDPFTDLATVQTTPPVP